MYRRKLSRSDLIDHLQDLEWSEPRTVTTKIGRRKVHILLDLDQNFWGLWRNQKEEMRALGVSVGRDENGEGEGWEARWWVDDLTPGGVTGPTAREPVPLPPSTKVRGYLDDEGAETLDPLAFQILKSRQRKAVMTHYSVFSRHRFSLDASEMGEGKTYIALALARTLGWNYAVICPAKIVSKWVDAACDPWEVEPEFIMSYETLRRGGTGVSGFVERIELHKATKFRWNLVAPLLFIFDEIQHCQNPESLNSALFHAATVNPHAATLGMSGTAVRDPMTMKVVGQAMGFFSRPDEWGEWARKNGCSFNFFGGLEFTKNHVKAVRYLTDLHREIFPEHGCRLLKSDSRAEGQPPHELFVTPVDAAPTRPKNLAKLYKKIDDDEDDDKVRAAEKGQDVSPLVYAIRDRQRAELDLVPYTVDQTREALDEGQSVVVFVTHDGTIDALLMEFSDALVLRGEVRKDVRREALRQFQANAKSLILINLAAGAEGIDLHDTSGLHPRYSLVLPTYKADTLLQAIGRTDRKGKLSVSSVEMPFLTKPIHSKMMKACQRKIDNLSLLNDGELSELDLLSGEQNHAQHNLRMVEDHK